MSEPEFNQDLAVEDVLEQLVSQFVDPLCFLRELVQNAIDAGSTKIDVTCTFEDDSPLLAVAGGLVAADASHGKAAELGTAIIRVVDFGEGMDGHIIDTRLTRLFSSDKEGDRTKLGKFGTGFISVFALQLTDGHPAFVATGALGFSALLRFGDPFASARGCGGSFACAQLLPTFGPGCGHFFDQLGPSRRPVGGWGFRLDRCVGFDCRFIAARSACQKACQKCGQSQKLRLCHGAWFPFFPARRRKRRRGSRLSQFTPRGTG